MPAQNGSLPKLPAMVRGAEHLVSPEPLPGHGLGREDSRGAAGDRLQGGQLGSPREGAKPFR